MLFGLVATIKDAFVTFIQTPGICKKKPFGQFVGTWCYHFTYYWGPGRGQASRTLVYLSPEELLMRTEVLPPSETLTSFICSGSRVSFLV